MRRVTCAVLLILFLTGTLMSIMGTQRIRAEGTAAHSARVFSDEAVRSTSLYGSLLEGDLGEIADDFPEINGFHLEEHSFFTVVHINYTDGLTDYEKMALQFYVQDELEPKWYIRYVEPNWIYTIPENPPPWPPFVIGELIVGFINGLPDPITVPDNFPTIQEAINAANEGDTIFVRNGTYYEHVVVNRSVSLVGESKAATVVDGGGVGTVIDVDSDNVTITGFEIRNCSMTWEDWGIALNHSSKSIVNGNIIKAVYAISVLGGSENRITDNSIVGDDGSCIFHGLKLANSSRNIVSHNNLSLDCHSAITMYNSTSNHISFNYISGHFVPFPFTMEKSNNNSIVGNIMWQPAPLFGGHISFTESSGNVFYHNAFLADEGPNTMSIDELSMNDWDNGYEGNYWSSYNGSDLDGDGIGDTYLPWEGVDNYPLMNLYWNPGDIDHDLDVDIFDVVKCGLAYGSTPSFPNWNPHCDIAEPYGVINIFDIVMIATSYGEEYTP